MVKKIKGKLWYCCPKCGKRLHPIQPGAVCRGVIGQCRGRLPNGAPCGWKGEIIIGEEQPDGDYTKNRGEARDIVQHNGVYG